MIAGAIAACHKVVVLVSFGGTEPSMPQGIIEMLYRPIFTSLKKYRNAWLYASRINR